MAIEPFLGTRAQQGFLLTVAIHAIIVLTMVGLTFGVVDNYVDLNHGGYKTVSCYLALFAFAELFELVMALDALQRRNIIQLVGICVFHAGNIVFAALQVNQTRTALVTNPGASCETDYANCSGPGSLWARVLPYLIVPPCIIGASLLLLIWFTWQLYHEFGWVVFHIVGANRQMKTMYRFYQVLICLLKFDFFCFSALTMQLLILVLSRNGPEFALTITALPIVLVLLTLCVVAVQREIKWLMTVSLFLMLPAQAYFIYKFSRLFASGSKSAYVSTRGTLAFFCIIAFIMLFATFAIGLRCFADFDKDLRDAKMSENRFGRLKKRPVSTYTGKGGDVDVTTPMSPAGLPDTSHRDSSYIGGDPLEPRMSIE